MGTQGNTIFGVILEVTHKSPAESKDTLVQITPESRRFIQNESVIQRFTPFEGASKGRFLESNREPMPKMQSEDSLLQQESRS